MSSRQAPFERFLNTQYPHDRVDVAGFCTYNHGSCGAPCGWRPNGKPYRKCAFHRWCHREHQRRYAQGRRAAKKAPYRIAWLDDTLGAADESIEVWTDEEFFAWMEMMLHSPAVPVEVSPPTELATFYSESEEPVPNQVPAFNGEESLDVSDLYENEPAELMPLYAEGDEEDVEGDEEDALNAVSLDDIDDIMDALESTNDAFVLGKNE